MTNPINYPNSQIPSYSGITINITNPNLTAPMPMHNYPQPQPHVCNSNCQHNYNNLTSGNEQKPTYVNGKFDNSQQSGVTNPNQKKYPENFNTYNNYAQPVQEVLPINNDSQELQNTSNSNLANQKIEGLPQTYPGGYYINNYTVNQAPETQKDSINQEKSQNPESINQNNPTFNNPVAEEIKAEDLNNSTIEDNANVVALDNKISPIIQSPVNAPTVLPVEQIMEEKDYNMDSSKEIITKLDTRVAEEKELEKNGKKTKIVALTNEYIMSLENYLNNPNREIRLMASKEILTRLDEDKDRFDDAALNALLNKMLQDPDKLVRIAALSAFSAQLASGNDFTVQLLNEIQNNPNADKEDVLEAANILLKMSSSTEIKYVPVKNEEYNPNPDTVEKQIA